MKIVRGHFSGGENKRFDLSGFYRNYAVLVLHEAFDLQKRMMNDDGMVTFEQLWCDDDVGHSSFVFEA